MPTIPHLIAFALTALGITLTPGPNMIYLISRAIVQGRRAALISLGGVELGLLLYMVCAAFGITAIFMAVPFAYDALRISGALYLLYLAWQAIRPGGHSPFQLRALPPDAPRRLFAMGFLTCFLNPKVAVLYLSLLPQFLSPERGHILSQSLALGAMQIAISIVGNGTVAMMAGTIARFLAARPRWATIQRWIMATVLGGLALRLAVEARR